MEKLINGAITVAFAAVFIGIYVAFVAPWMWDTASSSPIGQLVGWLIGR